MTIGVSITESQALTVLRAFLLSILPSGIEVVRGLVNRVPEPAGVNFVVMTPIMQVRLGTNQDTYADGFLLQPQQPGTKAALQATELTIQLDVHGPASGDNAQIISTLLRDEYATTFFQPQACRFTGSVAGAVLTVTNVASGALQASMTVTGPGVAAGTIITAQLSGSIPGDAGTYSVTGSQAVASAGMTATPAFNIAPLYSEDPKQLPFANGEQQIEERWVVDAVLQANPVITLPQDFSAAFAVGTVDVETLPPSP